MFIIKNKHILNQLSNNIIKYDVLNIDLLDKYDYIFKDKLKINIHKILDDKHMNIFGVRFNNQ